MTLDVNNCKRQNLNHKLIIYHVFTNAYLEHVNFSLKGTLFNWKTAQKLYHDISCFAPNKT